MLTIEIMKELCGHVGYDYEELSPEPSGGPLVVGCRAEPSQGVEFYTVRDYLARGESPKWTEGIEKCMVLGAAYELGSRDAEQEARLGMLRAVVVYGSKVLKGERKE
jgi:hypothetical protein